MHTNAAQWIGISSKWIALIRMNVHIFFLRIQRQLVNLFNFIFSLWYNWWYLAEIRFTNFNYWKCKSKVCSIKLSKYLSIIEIIFCFCKKEFPVKIVFFCPLLDNWISHSLFGFFQNMKKIVAINMAVFSISYGIVTLLDIIYGWF